MLRVFISAGHGGNDSGAVGNSLQEKNLNLQYALACRDVLVQHGIYVDLSREKDENDSVKEEVKEANAQNYNLAVSFHTNAGGGDGFECFYYSTNKNGKKLAQLFEKRIKELGQNSRGCKTGNHLYFVKNTKATAVLCESAFIDNKKDISFVDTVEEQRKVGTAYAKAILDYFGITYKTGNTQQKEAYYKVQVGAFKNKQNAEALASELKSKGYNTYVVSV